MTTLEQLDAELARLPATPKTDADLNARAELMGRRITLDQATRATADEANRNRHKPRGNLEVIVPASVGTSHHFGTNGRVICSRITEDGHLVLDLLANEFKSLLADKRFGNDWHRANPKALLALVPGH